MLTNRQTENISKTEATLILCGSSGERANFRDVYLRIEELLYIELGYYELHIHMVVSSSKCVNYLDILREKVLNFVREKDFYPLHYE